mgnify:CR=1 FL=1
MPFYAVGQTGVPFGIIDVVQIPVNAAELNGLSGSYFRNGANLTGVVNATTLDSQHSSYYRNGVNLTGTVNATQFDSQNSSYYRNAANLTGIAPNADLLDSLDSSYFRNGINLTGTINATQLDGQLPAYYRNAANITGTINASQLDSQSAGFYRNATNVTGTFDAVSASGNVSFDGGSFVFNEAGADKDFRIEGDTNSGLLFADASVDRIGIGLLSPASRLDVSGNYASNITAVAALDINCSTANYFTKTINGASTFTFSSPPASRAYAFALELTHTSGTITWPTSVKWPKDTAPTLTTGKTHIFIFVTDDGGTRWRGASLVDYVN